MKVLNPIFGDYSGKLGSIVFNQTRTGTVCRSLGVGRSIKTSVCMKNATLRKSVVSKWKYLTLAQKQIWNNYASGIWQQRPYSTPTTVNGYNCHTSLSYIKDMFKEMFIPCEYQNLTSSDMYFGSELETQYSVIPPSFAMTYNFYNYGTTDQISIGNYGVDLTDPLFVNIIFRINSTVPGPYANPNITNINGDKYAYMLYSTKPDKNENVQVSKWYSLHIATFSRMDEIYNAFDNDFIVAKLDRQMIIDNLRMKTTLSGNMAWYVMAVDSHGQQQGTYPFMLTTYDLENI
jgi:hypothetical protein